MFQITRLNRIIEIFPTLDAAFQSFAEALPASSE
jgi:hypothetical protein